MKIGVDILQSYPLLKLHENDELLLNFTSNVARIRKCWVSTNDGVEYSTSTICTIKVG